MKAIMVARKHLLVAYIKKAVMPLFPHGLFVDCQRLPTPHHPPTSLKPLARIQQAI